ncbi:hypothetical protein NQ152_00720 [Microbacterium sp. zg.B48]|uniref:hypothetical protein n=1 Tax=Microbacterium sp. zg.B48 TaxID=2969408 RepID=UPI00214B52CB|nr:hypothetical protein [Microbacterium sp. zg.B48]MCR2762022.1 hypothetical protein [Microbacterium sp. zg.B48]
MESVAPPPDEPPAAPARPAARGLRAAAARPARHVLSAYSGEHGVYGIVLVTALIAVGWDDDTDLEVLVFVVGTVLVFWLAHIYASVVASRAAAPPMPLRAALSHGIRHSSGMLVAMLVPALLLSLGALGLVEEYTAYFLALGSGLVMLALIGYANAARNGSSWGWRLAGIASTTVLGALVIGLSILAH